jgi:hypothetical protein
MKKILILLCALLSGVNALHADEGMWLLKLMKQQHLEDSLLKAGLKIPASELYNEHGSSMRECIGIFGNGCTGEVVSPEGLVLTNNHCGFSFVHAMSTMDKNYLKDGYFAKSRAEELPTPNLTFTFVLRIVDVTADVEAAAQAAGADVYTMQSQSFLEPLAEKLLKKSDLRKKKGLKVRIVPYFGANQFYMFYEQVYSDVRLVVNPPLNIGQFGGNTDNWIWPRQTCDFAMFRIYADKNGQPATYSAKNVPLQCDRFLPISLKGVDKGDYTMIMGFPGSTSRYLTASQVKLRTQSQNEPYVLAGNAQLEFLKKKMDTVDSLNLMLQDDYMSLGNVVKNFGGMNEAVKKINLVGEKEAEQAAFRQFAAQKGDAEYVNIIERIDSLCAANADLLFDYNLLDLTVGQQRLYVQTEAVEAMLKALQGGKTKEIEAAKAELKRCYDMSIGAYSIELDREKMALLLPYWFKHHRGASPDFLKSPEAAQAHYDAMYAGSLFRSAETFNAFLAHPTYDVLANDPLVKHWDLYMAFLLQHYAYPISAYRQERVALDRIYVRGLCEMYDWAKAPDANFTLRMTYGHVCDLKPRDGVLYDWRTTLTGMFEKESTTETDYFVHPRLKKMYLAQDYGPYAREDGQLPTCFLSNNDITGGNSGSAVLNAYGELIGLAFDGNIESLSSDLKFNPQLQRCINVDIRYVLFIIDRFGGSSYVLDEMDIRK